MTRCNSSKRRGRTESGRHGACQEHEPVALGDARQLSLGVCGGVQQPGELLVGEPVAFLAGFGWGLEFEEWVGGSLAAAEPSSKELNAGLEFATTTASGANNNGIILGWSQFMDGTWHELWESPWNKPYAAYNKPLCINVPAPGHNYGSVAFAVPGC